MGSSVAKRGPLLHFFYISMSCCCMNNKVNIDQIQLNLNFFAVLMGCGFLLVEKTYISN
jgi:hypothetical protein